MRIPSGRETGIWQISRHIWLQKSAVYPTSTILPIVPVPISERSKITTNTNNTILSNSWYKIKGIRCALCTDCFMAEATRQHNNANVLALGGRVVGAGLALKIVDTFLDTPFSNDERHIRRIEGIE